MANSQIHRAFELTEFTGLPGAVVTRLSGREEISRPFHYEVELLTRSSESDGAVDSSTLLGQSATVSFINGAGDERHVNGVVSAFTHVDYGLRHHAYRAVLRPAFWLLTRRADCRIFQKKTAPEIFAAVCSQAGLGITHRSALSAQYRPWEYRVQYRETDFDFLSRLLEHEGIYYYFEHSRGKHQIVLADDAARLTEAAGYKEVPYYPPSTAAAQRERDHLKSWTLHETF